MSQQLSKGISETLDSCRYLWELFRFASHFVVLNLGDEICTVPDLLHAQRLCATGEAATEADLLDKVGAHAAVIALLA